MPSKKSRQYNFVLGDVINFTATPHYNFVLGDGLRKLYNTKLLG